MSIAVVLMGAICCQRESSAWKSMDLAEGLINSEPDSAFTILNSISAETLSNKKEKARYALLKSMALDKNYVDTTVFYIL